MIDSFVPDHIRANYPDLIAFVGAYLDFLETTHESGYYQNTLPQQRDIESQEEEFLRRIEKEIGLFVPREYEASPRLFYNKISELWRAKGSREAVETFFQLFLNDTVQVRFPWDSVLKPSDGRWQSPEKLRVSLISGNPNDLANQRIQQIEEYGFTTVKKIERKVYADQTIYELTLSRGETIGNFVVGNRIITEDRSVVAEIYNSVSNVVIESSGSGYEIGDRIRLEGRSRISFEARVTNVNTNGGIAEIVILDFGSGTTPNHILEVQGSGRFFLNRFRVFQYTDDNRELDLGDNLDISEESVEILSSDDDYTLLNNYFDGFYVGRIVGAVTDDSLVDSPLTSSNIIITPSDPTEPLVFQVDSVDGTGATFSLAFSPIVKSEGYYDGVRGQLSESIVLQDSEFYQKFSYEVVTSYPIEQWIEPLKTHVHPSGTKPFGLINKIDRIDAQANILSNDVLVLTPQNRAKTSETVAKTFTKILGDCTICADDASVLSEEEIAFTKRIFESATTTDDIIVRLGPTFKFSNTSLAVDSGIITVQNYNDDLYFSSDYVGQSTSF
jgi:hypothetical protein